jgi:hypothetical protein
VQGEAQLERSARAGGDAHDVLGVRRRDDGSFQADAGPAGAVPQLFLEGQDDAQCGPF